ncbi:uncharacterized protein LOC112568699 isoform X2 [Pomacea canaliculata]|nr:uncharacterized protein LOC112568699 isoform X2 [Pomacea canaliculata]XP_025101918.1 uncharacterized protein LOC112568699 isoform X2 [Pomacea canaliculata]XP_025101919.1 uncharacterized protein LOC112568699 isoform X2 [Pomacea canaliculata]XP_025101920.1 uncharacterized protein LOC112568699 isoform X2 [Pomacea canaliculata]
MTLTCKATDVNPNPVYTWETDRCVTYDSDRGTCTLVPQVPWDDGTQVKCSARSREGNSNKATAAFSMNIVFPPPNRPVIKGHRQGNIVYFEEPLECRVQGGKPLVSEVTVSCNQTGVIYLGGTTVGNGGSFARRNFTFNTGVKGTTPLSCTCRGEWAPAPNLYQQTSDIVFLVKSPPQNPVINCSTMIPEGQSGTCECRLAPGDELPDGFSLTWPGHSNSQVMQMSNVTRLDNGRTFTCLLSFDGVVRSTTHTLHVAYGPEDEHMQVVGPDTFITNGTMNLNLTCNATEVNPSPSYNWSLSRCQVRENDGKSTCSFVPLPRFDDGLVIQCTAYNSRTQKKGSLQHQSRSPISTAVSTNDRRPRRRATSFSRNNPPL